jgi:hypothetical protein
MNDYTYGPKLENAKGDRLQATGFRRQASG